ncbi:hypothetical protein, partial [Stutzerimonas stutzeri]|uniref:hypothetical protein n=1 Tax=Stutzerimonas stutzeri TaxID=316 RepID=UPI0021086074
LLDAFGPEIQEQAPACEPESTLLDPLTRKEIRVLQLLCEGYSNSAWRRNSSSRTAPCERIYATSTPRTPS